jgi:hypothetical protein
MPPSDDDLDLQGWSLDALRKTALAYFGVGSDSDLPDDVRFLMNVTRLIRRRLERSGDSAETKLAVFCLFPVETDEDRTGYGRDVPMLDDGTSALGDRIWRVPPEAAFGTPLALKDADDSDAFAKVVAIGGGTVPTIVFKPQASTSELRLYPGGVADLANCRSVPLGGTAISLDEVLSVVDVLYRTQLVTPDAQSTLLTWKRSRPASNAEKVVQHYLKVGLSSAFPACRIVAEQPGVTGRTDLEIEEIMPGGDGSVVRHALLELKVLRGVNTSGRAVSAAAIRKWIKDGVDQAASYRDERGTKASALCCFDMRKTVVGDECFKHVRRLALRSHVSLRCWHLFASSAQYRAHEQQLAPAAG